MKPFVRAFIAIFLAVGFVPTAQAEISLFTYYQHVVEQTVLGDFDGDGVDDQIVGRPFGGSGEADCLFGEVFMYYEYEMPRLSIYEEIFPWENAPNSPNNEDPEPVRISITKLGYAPLNYLDIWYIGASLAAGDFDDDGFDDLVIGAPGAGMNRSGSDLLAVGRVFVLWGHADFFQNWNNYGTTFTPTSAHLSEIHQDSNRTWSQPEQWDYFGHSLAVGDLNCDGIIDLAIGVPFENHGGHDDAGAVQVFYGNTSHSGFVSSSASVGINEYDIDGEDVVDGEWFGYSLAAGRFNRLFQPHRCYSLAVGAPGEDRGGEGAVFVFYGNSDSRLDDNDVDRIDQSPAGVHSSPAAGDRFGTRIGVALYYPSYDDLWVSSNSDRCPDNIGRRFYQVFESQIAGVRTSRDWRHYCGLFPPNLLDRRGRVFEEPTALGGVSFYVPEDVPYRHYWPAEDVSTAILIQGRPAGPGERNPCVGSGNLYLSYHHNHDAVTGEPEYHWQTHADNEEFLLVSPTIQPRFFATSSRCVSTDAGKGYTRLGGSDGYGPYGFDEYVNDIMDDLALVGFYTETFRWFGHSAGGRTSSRYLWAHPERIDRMVIESAGSYLDDSWDDWNDGLGAATYTEEYPDWGRSINVRYRPTSHLPLFGRWILWVPWWWYSTVLTRPISLVVGFGDLSDHYDREELCMALNWRDMFNDRYGSYPGVQEIETCFAWGTNPARAIGHNSRALAYISAERLLTDNPWPAHPHCYENPDDHTPGIEDGTAPAVGGEPACSTFDFVAD